MRALLVGVGVVLGVAGCGSAPESRVRTAREIKEDYRTQWQGITAAVESQLVWPRCEIPPRPGKCGLMGNDLFAGGKNRIKEICPEEDPTEGHIKACQERIATDFEVRLRARYPRAVENDIRQYCAAQPEDCGSDRLVELAWMTSHNATILAEGKRDTDELVARRDRELEESARVRAQRIADDEQSRAGARAFFGAMSTGLSAASESLRRDSASAGCSSDASCRYGYRCVRTTSGSVCAQAR